MLELNYKIELKKGNVSGLVLECLYLVQINYTFNLHITSGDFRGVTKGFCVRKDQIKEVVETLESVNSNIACDVKLTDNDSDSYIRFFKNSKAKLGISGQVGASYEENYMCFRFESELTNIPQFISDLKELLMLEDID